MPSVLENYHQLGHSGANDARQSANGRLVKVQVGQDSRDLAYLYLILKGGI